MIRARRYSKKQRQAGLIFGLILLLSLILGACGDSQPTATPQPDKDLPKDRLLFLGNRDGWPDLYTLDLSGKVSGRLTDSPEVEFGAVWSPDGKKLAFNALNGDQANGDYQRKPQIAVTDAAGQNRVLVAAEGFNPNWSPDGGKVLFLRTSQDTTVTPTPEPSSAVPTAPFGRGSSGGTSGLTSDRPLKSSLYVAPADGSANGDKSNNTSTLVADNAVYGVWSPDGKRIAYISGNNDQTKPRNLFVMDADGNNKVNVSQRAKLDNLDILFVSWSPDGASLALTATDAARDKVSLYRLPPEGNSAKRLTDYQGSARELTGLVWAYSDYYNPAPKIKFAPVWSPTSRQIAFADGSSRLSIVELESGKVRSFPVGSAAIGQDKDSVLSVSWSLDGRRLIYDRAVAGRLTLLNQAENFIYDWFEQYLETMDALTGSITALAGPTSGFLTPTCCGIDLLGAGSPEPQGSTAPTPTAKPKPTLPTVNGVTPEGKLVYVSGFNQRSLMVKELSTGETVTLTNGPFKVLDFIVSPKNNKLAYIEVRDQYNATLYLSSLDGKQRRKLSEGSGEPEELSRVAQWSPDGRYLAFQVFKGDPNLQPGLYVVGVDVPDEQAAPRLISKEDISAFAWGPDNQTLAFRIDNSQFSVYTASINAATPPKLLAMVGLVNRSYSALGRGLTWSPDGQNIAVTGPGGYSRFATWLISPDGQVREIASSIIGKLVGWSSDSSRLIATTATFNQNTEVQVLNAKSATPAWRPYGPGAGPLISPDSKNIAVFTRYDNRFDAGGFPSAPRNPTNNSGLFRVTIIALNNGEQHDTQLDYPGYYSYKARFFNWSQDSKLLAFYQNNTVYAVGTDAKNPQPIARAFAVEKLFWIPK